MQHLVETYGLGLLFVLIMLESAGIPLPGETALIGAGLLAARGHFDIVLVIVVAAAAAIIGDNGGYWVGRIWGRKLLTLWGPLERFSERVLPLSERFFARHGYVVLVQDVRGRGNSAGAWYPFAHEAPDGYDTIEWAAAQPWGNGKVGTMGTSYMAAVQSAAATLNPPHLKAMFVTEGPSDYYSCSMRQNGALEQRFLIYAFHMAVTSKEARANPALRAALLEARNNLGWWLGKLPLKKGASPLRLLPSYEQWALDLQIHGNYDEYWQQRGYAIHEYYTEHADVPTFYCGAWYDSYARATAENFTALTKLKKSPQKLLMGPWTHGVMMDQEFAGDVTFGPDAVDTPVTLKRGPDGWRLAASRSMLPAGNRGGASETRWRPGRHSFH